MSYELHHGDCLEVLPTIPNESIDMILADPPYGTIDSAWDSIIDLPAMWRELKRVIKPTAAIVLFGAQPFTTTLIASNLPMFKYCWVWHKSRAADFVNAKNKPMRNHEDIVVFSDGTTANGSNRRMPFYPQGIQPIRRKEKPSASKFGNIAGKRPGHVQEYQAEWSNYPKTILEFDSVGKPVHPTQKPTDLLAYLIRTYTDKGDTVLDFTFGSGSTGVACVEEERNFIGIEMDDHYFKVGGERIHAEATKPRTMEMAL